MARQSKIDQINDAFIKILTEENAQQYVKYIKQIRNEMINDIENLTADKVKSIVKGAEINIDNVVLLFTLQSAILLVLDKTKPRKSFSPSLLPIIALIGMYSLKRPERFVKKVSKLVKGRGLNERDKKAKAIIDKFQKNVDDMFDFKDKARKIAIEKSEISIVKSKTNKRMIRDFKKLRQQGLSINDIKKQLSSKYNSPNNIKRVMNTELHAQSELVKKEFNKEYGYTHKTWKQRNRPTSRHTKFHDGVVNKTIPIDSDFRAGGLRAEYPGDDRLPPSERIYCDCYLVYSRNGVKQIFKAFGQS
jgi:DNA-binding transcriptional MerR regulator